MVESEALPPDEEVIRSYIRYAAGQTGYSADRLPPAHEFLLGFLRWLRSYWPTILEERQVE